MKVVLALSLILALVAASSSSSKTDSSSADSSSSSSEEILFALVFEANEGDDATGGLVTAVDVLTGETLVQAAASLNSIKGAEVLSRSIG